MKLRRAKFLPLLIAALMGVVGGLVANPIQAAAEDHPYTTPGQRTYNGRLWNTTCDQYSSTVTRCRAEIMASQARVVDGKYQLVNEFVFNNLTYLPSNGANWRDKNTGEINPLATDGQFTGTDGRLWKTECATEWTGQNGCRSFTFVTVVNAAKDAAGAWTFTPENKWVFNNVVQFVPGTRPIPRKYNNECDAPSPAGYSFTADGRPYVTKPGYEPADLYNPISLANFIKVSLRSNTLDDADKLCFALLGAEHLLEGGHTDNYNGRTSLWFPYPFGFSANPGVDDLKTGWYSGLGQAGAMTAFMELGSFTGNNTWYTYASQLFESYMKPFTKDGKGGFTNRLNGFLWFEEYPTTPTPTVVYNGHFQAVLALRSWYQYSGDVRAKNLFDEAVEDLKVQVPRMRIAIDGGTMSSYDMLRGYETAPLRAVVVSTPKPTPTASPTPTATASPSATASPTASPTATATATPTSTATATPTPTATSTVISTETATEEPIPSPSPSATTSSTPTPRPTSTAPITETLLNGSKLSKNLATGKTAVANKNLLKNSALASNNNGGVPNNWSAVNRNASALTLRDGWVGVKPQGSSKGWAGIEQTIPVTSAIANKELALSFNSRLEITSGQAGTAGKVPVYSVCTVDGKTETKLIHENAKNRTRDEAWSTTSFKAPAAGCDIKIQFLTYSYSYTNTTAWYKNPNLRVADTKGAHTSMDYNLKVYEQAENVLTLKGNGSTVRVEAYDGGRWQEIETVVTSDEGVDVTIPERYTGRNVNINYHDGHISELQRIACYSGARVLDTIAEELSHTATSVYDANMFGNKNKNCVPEAGIPLAMGDEVMFVAAEVEPMEIQPAAVPTSMELEPDSE